MVELDKKPQSQRFEAAINRAIEDNRRMAEKNLLKAKMNGGVVIDEIISKQFIEFCISQQGMKTKED